MSLTRAEWLIMWRCVRRIQKFVTQYSSADKKTQRDVLVDIETIKDQIQSVVGQLD
jgi:hypothetical protein